MFNLWEWEEEGGAATELMLSRQSMCLKSWKNQAGTRKWLSQAICEDETISTLFRMELCHAWLGWVDDE